MTEPIADFPQIMPEPVPASYELTQEVAPQSSGFWSHVAFWAGQLSIADGVVAVTVLVAALLRFSNLGGPLLTPSEATAALSSWQFGHAGAAVTSITSPAYFTLTNAAMLLFGSSDTIARLVPALMGTLTVGLVWLLRRAWGPVGMVAAAIFLALSPLNILASRTAGGAAPAILALMLIVVGMVRLITQGRKRWAYAVGVALGLGLTSDPLFISGLLTLIPIWFWLANDRADERDPASTATLLSYWRPIAVAFSLTFLLLSTSFLLYPPGIGSAFGLTAEWLGAFRLPTVDVAGTGLLAPFLTTLRYEPALYVLGLPALLWALTSRHHLAGLLAGWWILLVALSIFHPALITYPLLFTLPGYLLIGLLARTLFNYRDVDHRVALAVAGGLVLLGMVLLVSIARYTRLALWSSDQAALLALALVAFIAAGGLLVLAMSHDSRAAQQGAFLGLAVLMLYLQWGTATNLTRMGANDPHERIVVEGTDDDMRILSNLLGDLSRQVTGAGHDLDLISLVDSPVLRWYLRDFEHAQFAAALPIHAQPQAVISPAETELRIGDDYLGADFGLLQSQLENEQAFSLNDTMKWLLFHESNAPIHNERIILWVRSDLTGGGGS